MKREGCAQARRREFEIIEAAVRKNKERFVRRLQALVRTDGDCVRFLGARTKDGYGRLSFRYGGKHVLIYAHRLFLILRLGRQIRLKHDAGHLDTCPHRDCVRHVFEQHYLLNAAGNGKGTAEQFPF